MDPRFYSLPWMAAFGPCDLVLLIALAGVILNLLGRETSGVAGSREIRPVPSAGQPRGLLRNGRSELGLRHQATGGYARGDDAGVLRSQNDTPTPRD